MKITHTFNFKFSLISGMVLIFLLLTFVQLNVQAAWVENMPVRVENPDGTVIHCFASGDEFFNYLHDKDGYTIIQAPNGFYYYAISSGDTLKPSSYRVGDAAPRSLSIAAKAGISEVEYQRRKDEMFRHVSQEGVKSTKAAHKGVLNNIVIYIRFSDDTEFTTPRSTFDARLNNNSNPSVKHYFQEVSYGMVTVESHHFPPSASMNVNVSYQDIYPREYYLPYNATTNPTGYTSSQRTEREHQLLHRAVSAVANQIPGDLNIDNDNDGRVDNVCFIIKGDSGDWGSILWAHRWMLYTTQTFINGKRVWDYTFQPETQSTVTILNHELFHTFGAPDLYRYQNTTITPVGPWDLMHSGSGHMGAYMKWKYSNKTWISDIPVISQPGTYTLNPLTSAQNNAFRINSPHSSTEYFLVEYRRKQSGTYDNNIPASGLLIYRINTAAGNGNAGGPPDEVYLYRPNGTNTVNGNVVNANYSAQTGRTTITDATNPSSFLSNSGIGGLDISNITTAGETISFDLFGGGTPSHNINVSASPAHGGTVSGGGSFQQGQTATVTATAASNFTFQHWTENGTVVSTQPGYAFHVTASRNLVASFQAQETIFTISINANPTEGGQPTGAGSYTQGSSVSLAAHPAAAYNFVSWIENGQVVSTQQTFTFTAGANRQITANYQIKTYAISLSANLVNAGNLAGAGTYNHGSTRSVSAFAAEGFAFENWTENGQVVSTSSQYTFQLTAPRNLIANFKSTAPVTFTINATASPAPGGTISGTGTYTQGQTASLTANPATGYGFVSWSENGNIVSNQANYSFEVTGNRSLTANFTLNTHTITLQASPAGAGTLNGAGSYSYGQTANISAVAVNGYAFAKWQKNEMEVSTQPAYSFIVTKDYSLVAVFIEEVPDEEEPEEPEVFVNITARAQPNGAGFVSGAGQYPEHNTVTLVATPVAGNFEFQGWVENGIIVSVEDIFVFPAATDRNLTARFKNTPRNFQVNATANLKGEFLISGTGMYREGDHVELEIFLWEGIIFTGWRNHAGQIVSRANPYVFSANRNLTLEAVLQVNELENGLFKTPVKVYPNPNPGAFWVDTEQESVLYVRNTAGLVVHQQSLYVGSNPVNIEFLPIGMYMLHFYFNDKVVSSKIIIK